MSARDGFGITGTANLEMSIDLARLAITATTLSAATESAPYSQTLTAVTPPAGVVGSAYTVALSAIGGVTPYTWAIASGSLPLAGIRGEV